MTWSNFLGAEICWAEDDGNLLVPGLAHDEGGPGQGDGPGQRPGQRQHLGQIPAAATHRWGVRSFYSWGRINDIIMYEVWVLSIFFVKEKIFVIFPAAQWCINISVLSLTPPGYVSHVPLLKCQLEKCRESIQRIPLANPSHVEMRKPSCGICFGAHIFYEIWI